MSFPLRLSFWCVARSLALLGASSLAPVVAQTAVSPHHVTFYTEPNFKGEALIVEAGASVDRLARMMRPSQQPWLFAISSVKVEGAARATLYSGENFSGHRVEISSSVSDLYALSRGSEPGATWDRAIASVSVTGPRAVVVPAPPPPVRYETAPPPAPVYVVPTPSPAPPPRPMYDRRTAESIVHRAYREVLGRSADPEGLRVYRDRLMREGWTERQLIQQLQRSSEARAIDADDAIGRAYREVLGRDPDPSGLAHYRGKWRDGWTQGQIRDDLRRSLEGREANMRAAITRAYRDLLGREPDPGGYATYERLMRERGYSERDVRQSIMSSDEYRQRNPGRGR